MNTDLKTLKTKIIKAALPHIAEMGWTLPALIKGGEEAGIEAAEVKLAFEGREKEALKHYSLMLDEQMLEALHNHPEFETMKVHQKVRFCVVARLQLLNPHKKVALKTSQFLKNPAHATLGPKMIYNTVNEIWYGAGDTSTDYNFYTKRAILAGVYGSTLMHWLRSSHEDLAPTIEFLDKRLKDSAKIPNIKQDLCQGADLALAPFKSLFNGMRKS